MADITKEMDLSCKLPASEDVADPGAYTTPSIVIGSLDLTIGKPAVLFHVQACLICTAMRG